MSETSTARVPARDLPVPRSVSPEAQAFLAQGGFGPATAWPADERDLHAWQERIAKADNSMKSMIRASGLDLDDRTAALMGCGMEELDVNGVPVHIAMPPGTDTADDRVCLYLHGGAWQEGGGTLARFMAAVAAVTIGARTWGVDYRMPPGHPFPAPLDDCLAAYRRLLETHEPEQIVVSGVSAGGNLAAALMLRAHDEGLPLPAAVILDTPATDLTEAGDTWSTNLGIDLTLNTTVGPAIRLYAGGHDLHHPYLSPLFGELGPWYPPAILLSGTRDLILSDTVRFHRALLAAGAIAELHVFEAQGHSGFGGQAPEDRERSGAGRAFAERHWAKTER